MRRRRVLIAAGALVVLAGVVTTVALTIGRRPSEVEIVEVTRETLSLDVVATGRVQAAVRADVVPPTAGTLESVEASDGQFVKAGQVIARLNLGQLESQLRQAEAGERAARAQVAAIRDQGPTQDQVDSADQAVATAKQTYDQTAAAADSLEQLIGGLPEDTVGDADASVVTDALVGQAYGQYQQALAQRAALDVDTSSSDDAAQAQADQAAEQVRLAQQAVNDAAMEAPIDGIVVFNAVSAGGLGSGAGASLTGGGGTADLSSAKPAEGTPVNPQQPPFSVVQLGSMQFSAEVDEADITKIKPGLGAAIRLDAFEGRSFDSTVTRVLPQAQSTSTGGTVFPVLLPLTDSGANLLVGMQGDATIRLRSVPDAVTIPVEAMYEERGKRIAYAVSGGRLRRRVIQTGVVTETRVQVTEGLEPGDQVLVSGPDEVADGMRVSVKG